MVDGNRIGAILLMGGEGNRFGGETPKQFLFLGGKRVYLHTLEAFQTTGLFDEILLVCHPDWVETAFLETSGVQVISGGATRQKSSYLGLKSFSQKPDVVAIHDAVRPFVSGRIIEDNVHHAILHGAVDTCIPSADTLVHAPSGKQIAAIPNRGEFLRGQTPQTFRYEWIWEAHQAAFKDGLANSSDDCRLILRRGRPVHVVAGSEENLKITTEIDLLFAEELLIRRKKQSEYSCNKSSNSP